MLRGMPKVRQTDAFVAPALSAVITVANFSASIPKGLPPCRPRRRAAARPAFTLLSQGTLELRQGTKDVEKELALRRGGIHLFGQRPEGEALLQTVIVLEFA